VAPSDARDCQRPPGNASKTPRHHHNAANSHLAHATQPQPPTQSSKTTAEHQNFHSFACATFWNPSVADCSQIIRWESNYPEGASKANANDGSHTKTNRTRHGLERIRGLSSLTHQESIVHISHKAVPTSPTKISDPNDWPELPHFHSRNAAAIQQQQSDVSER
jgi:hypothetical protein